MKNAVFFLCIILAVIYSLSFPFEITHYISVALKLCATSVIPSLFMFMVLSGIMAHTLKSIPIRGKVSLFLSRTFGLPTTVLPICLLGLFCGAPSGTLGICELYSSGMCSKDEAERAIIISNNCSAAFILSIVSSALASTFGAVIILFSNIITTVIIYLLVFKSSKTVTQSVKKQPPKIHGISNLITSSITSSAQTMLMLCGHIVFFYCISAVISEKLCRIALLITQNHSTAGFVKAAASSLFEVTTGVLTSASLSENLRFVMISAGVAFCGLSIIFQVISIASKYKLSCARFIYSKILCSLLSPLITLLLLFIIPKEVPVMNSTVLKTTEGITSNDITVLVFITCICIAGGYILAYLDKKHKN